MGSMLEKFVAFVPYLQLSRITHKHKKNKYLNIFLEINTTTFKGWSLKNEIFANIKTALEI
jgi:hypothetical protein